MLAPLCAFHLKPRSLFQKSSKVQTSPTVFPLSPLVAGHLEVCCFTCMYNERLYTLSSHEVNVMCIWPPLWRTWSKPSTIVEDIEQTINP